MALGTKVVVAPAATAAAVLGRRRSSKVFLGTSGGGLAIVTVAYGTYKAKYDPPHLVWDLDNTILCSVSPTPKSTTTSARGATEASSPATDIDIYLDSFEHIDDDFPFESDDVPNTKTYWRPGARLALSLCSYFAVQHVYTTAQGTYTDNILNQIDTNRTFFILLYIVILHRNLSKMGKI